MPQPRLGLRVEESKAVARLRRTRRRTRSDNKIGFDILVSGTVWEKSCGRGG